MLTHSLVEPIIISLDDDGKIVKKKTKKEKPSSSGSSGSSCSSGSSGSSDFSDGPPDPFLQTSDAPIVEDNEQLIMYDPVDDLNSDDQNIWNDFPIDY